MCISSTIRYQCYQALLLGPHVYTQRFILVFPRLFSHTYFTFTLRVSGERSVARYTENERARHGEHNADMGDHAPSLLARLNQRIVD